MKLMLAIVLLSLPLASCSSGPATVTAPTDQQRSQLLGQIEKLAGTWEMTDEKGETRVGAVFSVTSGGTAVREVMFPGQGDEMTNLYHMDGPSMILTHYCAVGNQPRMRAVPGPQTGTFEFNFDSVTNLHEASGHYMGQMRLTIVDKDHIRQDWFSFAKGKLEGPTTFDLRRKR